MLKSTKSKKDRKSFAKLRKQYPTFEYRSFEWKVKGQKLDIAFNFECGDINFKPTSTIQFPKTIQV